MSLVCVLQFEDEINKNFTWIDKVAERRDVQPTTSGTWQAAELEYMYMYIYILCAQYPIVV